MRKMPAPFTAMSPALLRVRRLRPFLGRVISPATINSYTVITMKVASLFCHSRESGNPFKELLDSRSPIGVGNKLRGSDRYFHADLVPRGVWEFPAKAGIHDRTGCRSNKTICTVAGLFALLWLCLLIGGCAKPAPAWFAAGHQQLESFKTDFLTGAEPRLVELRFNKVLRELKKSGDLDLLQKAWLTQMALQVAALEKAESGDYIAAEAALTIPANRQFYLFLMGDPAKVDTALLPEAYRPFWTALKSGNAAETVKKISLIEDPLSRLIAAGASARLLPMSEELLLMAVDTASQNGWKRALLAWLKELKGFYEKNGDTAKAEAIGRRLAVITP
jgi:hypothetical protein